MLKNFRSYQLAKELYQICKGLPTTGEVRDQLNRASLSVCLNLAEGSGKTSLKDQKRFYTIAMGSLRETQAILDLSGHDSAAQTADKLGGLVWRLINSSVKGP